MLDYFRPMPETLAIVSFWWCLLVGICLFIGPPGGFTTEELEFFKLNHIEKLSLGKNILRTETAAIASAFFLSQNIS